MLTADDVCMGKTATRIDADSARQSLKPDLQRDLAQFSAPPKSRRERASLVSWFVMSNLLFRRWFFPRSMRPPLLRVWGARIGTNVLIRENVYIHMPWHLEVGDNSQIGRASEIYNHVPVRIGKDVCISQYCLISSSGHDPLSISLQYRHRQVAIEDGAWLTLGTTVCPGSKVPQNLVTKPGAVISPKSLDFAATRSTNGD